MADEEQRPDKEPQSSDPEFEEDPAPASDPEFETDEPPKTEGGASEETEAEAASTEAKDEDVEEGAATAAESTSLHEEDTVQEPVAEIVAQVRAKQEEKSSGSHGGGIGHIAPMPLLIGVLAALILLTILTVAVTAVDLGGQGNFIVAMVIATVKAILVMGYFMHLFWDSKFNVVAFGSSFLFALLFLGMALLDRQETQPDIDAWEADQKMMQK